MTQHNIEIKNIDNRHLELLTKVLPKLHSINYFQYCEQDTGSKIVIGQGWGLPNQISLVIDHGSDYYLEVEQYEHAGICYTINVPCDRCHENQYVQIHERDFNLKTFEDEYHSIDPSKCPDCDEYTGHYPDGVQ